MNMCGRPFHEWFYKPLLQARPSTADNSNKRVKNGRQDDDQISALETGSQESKSTKTKSKKTNKPLQIKDKDNAEEENDDESVDLRSQTSSKQKQKKQKKGEKKPELIDQQQVNIFEGEHMQLQIAFSGNIKENAKLGFFDRLQVKRKQHISNNNHVEKRILQDLDSLHEDNEESEEEEEIGNNEADHDPSPTYLDDQAMKFREQLYMESCARHNNSIMFASIRYDELILIEFIIHHVQESEAIDQENIYGDTCLTLACRLGKVEFVKLLVQHGADVNKETFNGRTGKLLFIYYFVLRF